MSIEADRVRFLSGLRFGKTTGAPLALLIENGIGLTGKKIMPCLASGEPEEKRITAPRPGHARPSRRDQISARRSPGCAGAGQR